MARPRTARTAPRAADTSTAPRTSFDRQLLEHVFEPSPKLGAWAWDLDRIRRARTAHVRGDFTASAHLADAMRDDAAIFATLAQRVSPAVGLPLEVLASDYYGGRGTAEVARVEAQQLFARGAALPPGTIADTIETMAMMGTFIGQNHWTPRPDGSRIDVAIRPWPMHAIKVHGSTGRYQALTRDGVVDVDPGDGKWIVVEAYDFEAWRHGAVRPLALVWPDRSYGVRDRSMLSETQGQPHIIGTLPAEWRYDSEEGKWFVEQVKGLRRARSGMAKPHGSTVEYLEISAAIFQIFENIIKHEESITAKVLLGQDGTSENAGGNYMKARLLFNVRNDIVEQDLGAAESGLNRCSLYPWAMLNFGDQRVVTRLKWRMPDLAEDERRESLAKRRAAFNADVKAFRENGFEITQELVDRLAKGYGIDPAPKLAPRLPAPAAPAAPAGADTAG